MADQIQCRHSSLWWSVDTTCSTIVLLFSLPSWECTLIISATCEPRDLAQLNVASSKLWKAFVVFFWHILVFSFLKCTHTEQLSWHNLLPLCSSSSSSIYCQLYWYMWLDLIIPLSCILTVCDRVQLNDWFTLSDFLGPILFSGCSQTLTINRFNCVSNKTYFPTSHSNLVQYWINLLLNPSVYFPPPHSSSSGCLC